MRVRFQEEEGPYPLVVLRGRLRLSGLSDREASSIIEESMLQSSISDTWTEAILISFIDDSLRKYPRKIRDNFKLLTTYEQTRGESDSNPSLIVILEGASATGKSMLAVELVRDLACTRFISTDTIRQILRGIYDKESYPELFCHTYQAYKHKQSGGEELDPVVRGYVAQSEILIPHIRDLIQLVIGEGAIAVCEGVHLQPGTIRGNAANILEIVINPDPNAHKTMFLSKNTTGKLRSVSQDLSVRNQEFNAARKIQDYLVSCALQQGVPIVNMESYEEARMEISNLILDAVRNLLKQTA